MNFAIVKIGTCDISLRETRRVATLWHRQTSRFLAPNHHVADSGSSGPSGDHAKVKCRPLRHKHIRCLCDLHVLRSGADKPSRHTRANISHCGDHKSCHSPMHTLHLSRSETWVVEKKRGFSALVNNFFFSSRPRWKFKFPFPFLSALTVGADAEWSAIASTRCRRRRLARRQFIFAPT